MSRDEIIKVLNKINLMYRNAFVEIDNPRRMQMYIEIYSKALNGIEFIDIDNAIDNYIQNSESNYSPNIKTLILLAKQEEKKRLSKVGKSVARIETPEEVASKIFHKEMKKPYNKRDYELLEMTKKYAGIFQDEELYKKHFGKAREEFERI